MSPIPSYGKERKKRGKIEEEKEQRNKENLKSERVKKIGRDD